MAEYTLPDLPYDYDALEPHISGRIMELHHDKHHGTYVAGANTALERLAEARDKGALETVNLYEKNLAFNLAGHINHAVFWVNLSPDGGDRPVGDLATAIDEHFGSFDAFQKHFAAAQPDPWMPTAAAAKCFWNASNDPKCSSIAVARSPTGRSPPSGERFTQNTAWLRCPARLNARFFSYRLTVSSAWPRPG